MEDAEDLHQRVHQIFEVVKVLMSEYYQDTVTILNDNGEHGVALEFIGDGLLASGKPISSEVFAKIEAAGRIMEVPEETWLGLRSLVEKGSETS
ncbi:MAG: hypothetical protein QOF78_3920 [Phycisphaerales bacterium]|jgi:hypothetical protein|nr:hypothetical protein [Phycisphaerales bacterium]